MKPITRQQREALRRLYQDNCDGSPTYRDFRKRWAPEWAHDEHPALIGIYVRMTVGIEPDGYVHS